MEMEKKKLKLDEGSYFDRLSSLPDAIRAHILSYLPTKAAVRTCILSNTWRALWTQLPNFDLSFHELGDILSRYYYRPRDNDSVVRARNSFYEFLDRAFMSILMLEKLKLYVPGFGSDLKSRVDNWVDCAFGYRLSEFKLHLGVESTKDELRYSLPVCVFESNLITKLGLIHCEVNESSLMNIHLPSLCCLFLECVYINDEMMSKLLANCPNLKDFNLDTCYDLYRVEISGFAKLEKVQIRYRYERKLGVEIEAPSLLELTYECEELCDNEGYCDFELFDCVNLKSFTAIGTALDDMDLNDLLRNLPALERLELHHCDCLRFIEISNPRLVHLALIRCEWLRKAEINAPNLKVFHYDDDKPIQLPLKGLTPKLKEASIYLKPEFEDAKWYAGLIKFFAKFRHCERLELCVGSEKDLIIPQKVRMKTRPRLSGVKNLMVSFRVSFMKRTSVSLIENLLWLAPCLETISMYNDYGRIHKTFKFTYEKPLKSQKKCGCWKSLPVNCWRHSLHKVSIVNKKAAEDETRLTDLFQNGRFDGKKVECSHKIYVPEFQNPRITPVDDHRFYSGCSDLESSPSP